MVGTIRPKGAIAENLVAYRLPKRDDGACFVLDANRNVIQIDECDYERLEKEGVQIYEGRIKKSRYNQL